MPSLVTNVTDFIDDRPNETIRTKRFKYISLMLSPNALLLYEIASCNSTTLVNAKMGYTSKSMENDQNANRINDGLIC